MSQIPKEIIEAMRAMLQRAAEETGNKALQNAIECGKIQRRTGYIISGLIPGPETVMEHEQAEDITADVKEYLELVEAGLQRFMEAHAEKYGKEALDKRFLEKLREVK